MANKRDLKKYVRTMCGALAGECVLSSEFVDGVDRKKMDEALLDAADLQGASLEVITFYFDKSRREFDSPRAYKKARRAYFKHGYAKFAKEFEQHVGDILKKMNSAIPEEARAEAKKG